MATVSASVEPAGVEVPAGDKAEGQLHVRHDGAVPERVTLAVVGDDASWVSVTPFALSIEPGATGTARIFFRPQRTPALRAGPHQVTIRVRLDSDRKQETAATVDVEIPAFAEVSVALGQPESTGRQSWNSPLSIDNRGNGELRATVAGVNPSGHLDVTAVPSSVQLEPGGGVEVQVGTRSRRRAWGASRDRPLTVTVLPGDGDPITVTGSVHQAAAVSLPVLVAVAVVVVALVAIGIRAVTSSSPSRAASSVAAPVANCPGAGHLAHDANGQIRSKVTEPDNFSFLFLQPGGCLPVRWNPCASIHYVVNGAAATAAQVADTRQAVADASQATGIDFVFDGDTTETPEESKTYDPSLYPGRWAPVLIDWAHLGGANNLTEVAGGGVPMAVGGVDVTGVMFLNVDAHLANNAPVPTGFGPGVTWGRILLHELGHVLGLGHVTGFEQIMHEPVTDQDSPTSAYGFGDLAGLRLLGRSAGCLTTPPVPGAAAA